MGCQHRVVQEGADGHYADVSCAGSRWVKLEARVDVNVVCPCVITRKNVLAEIEKAK